MLTLNRPVSKEQVDLYLHCLSRRFIRNLRVFTVDVLMVFRQEKNKKANLLRNEIAYHNAGRLSNYFFPNFFKHYQAEQMKKKLKLFVQKTKKNLFSRLNNSI